MRSRAACASKSGRAARASTRSHTARAPTLTNAARAPTPTHAVPATAWALLSGLALCFALQVAAQTAQTAPPAPHVAHSAAECRVWERELSFARSVETHDERAFLAHLHPGAVFDAGSADAIRGRDVVAQAWRGLIGGRGVLLRWRPGVVSIGGDPDIALSRGPYVLEDPRAEMARRYRVGWFQSVWVRDRADGEWRVLFDGSAAAPKAVEDADAATRWLAANSPEGCTPG